MSELTKQFSESLRLPYAVFIAILSEWKIFKWMVWKSLDELRFEM